MSVGNKGSWWLCPPEEFYQKAADEATRMRVEALPAGVEAFFARRDSWEEEVLRSGHQEAANGFKAPSVSAEEEDIPAY